jgi:hypothetical protein
MSESTTPIINDENTTAPVEQPIVSFRAFNRPQHLKHPPKPAKPPSRTQWVKTADLAGVNAKEDWFSRVSPDISTKIF